MTVTTPVSPTAASSTAASSTASVTGPASGGSEAGPLGEASLRGSFVAILTPFAGLAAGWLAGFVANHVPGVHLDQGQITTFMVSAVVTVLGTGLKWLHGWQAHEARVGQGTAAPIKPRRAAGTAPAGAGQAAHGPTTVGAAAGIPAPTAPLDEEQQRSRPVLVEEVVVVETPRGVSVDVEELDR